MMNGHEVRSGQTAGDDSGDKEEAPNTNKAATHRMMIIIRAKHRRANKNHKQTWLRVPTDNATVTSVPSLMPDSPGMMMRKHLLWMDGKDGAAWCQKRKRLPDEQEGGKKERNHWNHWLISNHNASDQSIKHATKYQAAAS